jgi:two-component system NtrC family sensor kinase
MAKKELILLALDESPFRELVKRALHAAGYETAESSNRASLQRAVQETSPSLLLIGERLDGESGMTLAREQLDRFPTLPILLYVEKDSGTVAKEALAAGLAGYLFPPLRTDDIVSAVTRSLTRARHLGDWVRREVKNTTASLQRQIGDLEAIFKNIGDAILIIDKEECILLANESIHKAFGVPVESLLGKPISAALPHPDLLALLARPASEELKYHEINMDDGRVYNAHLTQIPRVGSAITIQDISYLKELDRIKSDFVHTVSHDLRSPLTSVLGYAELVGRAGPLNNHQREFLGRLQSSVQDITALVNDLLDIGRLEAGFDTRREIVQLENILTYTVDILAPQIKAKELRVRVDQSPRLPPLKANPLRLRQMLDNLITNAIKYSNPGGDIHISLRSESNQIIFQITDNGAGIPPTDLPRVFEKFYRGENVPDTVIGTGLGLAIVKSIVESHQGRVWVESKLGEGSSFFVVLPIYETSAP